MHLFLDFDGPLIPDRVRIHLSNTRYPGKLKPNCKCDYWEFDPVAVSMLNNLQYIAKFKTVVSSTWRGFCSKEYIQELFLENGLFLDLADDWKTKEWFNSSRGLEIEEYIQRNNIGKYVILDDRESGGCIEFIDSIDKSRLFYVDMDSGISSRTYQNIKQMVSEWSGKTYIPPLW